MKRLWRREASSRAKGLTLVEVVVVIAIIALLTGLILPAAGRARKRAREAQCAHNLMSLGTALAATCTNNNGAFPNVYYTISGSAGTYTVALNTGTADSFFGNAAFETLLCPHDDAPVEVVGMDHSGNSINVKTSYGYNISLAALYRNMSRVSNPATTVTFFDGDASALTGTWENSSGWASKTIRARHSGGANYLYVDGHVDMVREPDVKVAFEGGGQWIASALSTAPVYPPVVAPPTTPTAPALPHFPTNLCLFGANSISLGSGAILNNAIGSSGNISLDNGAQARDIFCGGNVTSGSQPIITGNVVANGLVNLAAGQITGAIDAGGAVTLQTSLNRINSGGNISISGSAAGSLYSAGTVNAGSVGGSVIATGAVTITGACAGNIDSGSNVQVVDVGAVKCGGTANVTGTASGLINAVGNVTVSTAQGGVSSGGSVTIQNSDTGDINAAGNVTISGSSTGTIRANGAVTLKTRQKLTGSIWAGSGATLEDKGELTGDAHVRGTLTLGKQAVIDSNAEYTGSISLGNGAKVLGTKTKVGSITFTPTAPSAAAAPPARASYAPITLPAPTSIQAGGQNIIKGNSEVVNLAPGTYGGLTLGTQCTLRLSKGAYFFSSFSVGNNLDLTMDCSGGKVQIYVAGDVSLGTMLSLAINGGNASNVYMETHGKFSTVNNSTWRGIVYAPYGDIVLGSGCIVTGSLFSGHTLVLNNNAAVSYAAAP